MSAAGRVWAVAAGRPSATKIKTRGSNPQTVGGKVGGSFVESKMREQIHTVFLLPEQARRRLPSGAGGMFDWRYVRIALHPGAVEAGGSEDYRKSATPSRRKRCLRDRSSR
jgi:hypothetical protein